MSYENGLTREKILIVDDVPENLKLLGEILKSKYKVSVANSGERVLEILRLRKDFDLFLLDIMMPEMDGIELCKRIKSDTELFDVPVIFISALTDIKDKSQAFESGGVDYITKPFNREEVLLRVETHLKIRGLQKELKLKNMELQENLNKLRELERLRDNLVHMIVHDMRSPLTGVLSMFEILKIECEGLKNQEIMEYIKSGYYSANTLIEMINSLLDISRLEEGKLPLNISRENIKEIMSEAIKTIALNVKKMDVITEMSDDSIYVDCDKELIKRVIINLVNNSIKHSCAKSPIVVKVEKDIEFITISVIDDGIGIPEEYHKKIFEKFGQVEMRQEKKKYSTGLGLTFCKLAVEVHKGKIGVESSEGKGSRFYFSLPLCRQQ